MDSISTGVVASEQLVESLLGAVTDPVAILDELGHLMAANSAATEALRLPAGASFPDLFGPGARSAWELAKAGGEAWVSGVVGERHLAWKLHPVAPAGGTVSRIIATGHDTASLIAERREFFHKVLEALPIGINILSPTTMSSFYMNDAFVRINGWPREVVLDPAKLLECSYPDPEDRARVMATMAADRQASDVERLEWSPLEIVTETGAHRHVLSITTPVRDLDLFIATMQDVTAWWRAQVELERSERRFRVIAERTGHVVYDCDLGTGKVHWAGAIERVTGHRPEELATVDRGGWEQRVHPEDRAALQQHRSECIASEQSREVVYRLQRKDGSFVWVEDSAVVVRARDGGARLLGRMKDISERIRAEAERERLSKMLQHAQRMESIGRLAGGVAHDFNNLLTGILGNVSLAQLDLDGENLPEQLSQIELAAESAAALTRQLLSFSRAQVIEPRVLDVGKVLERLERLLERTIGEDIELRVTARARGRTKVDLTQLEQIVMNLAVNARDAMPTGGKLVLETADVVLDDAYCQRHAPATAGPYVLLAVSDTGTGLTEEVRARLFEPFFTTKPRGKGTGLGLATVYGAVKQNNGLIDVYSEAGRGTTFKVYFPCVEERPDALPTSVAHAAEDLPRGTETILLVEDDEPVRRFATKLLDRLGYTVLATASGAEAFETLRSQAGSVIHLLFTDVVLPGITGRELAETLQARHAVPRVLFTSGYTEDVVIRHGVLEHGIDFLPKPYRPVQLARKVRQVLDAPPKLIEGTTPQP